MRLKAHSRLVMIGDSVTDCERARPHGEGLFGAVGKGYVMMIDAFLQSQYPQLGVRLINMGTSGNTVRDLAGRWQTDVLDLKPDWLTIMIGINDVWRQFDMPRQPDTAVQPEEYERTLDKLVKRTMPTVKGLVLATPYIIEASGHDAMRRRMDEYGTIVKAIARKHGALVVDTQAAFDTVLQHMHAMAIAWDRIHPNHIGHAILARAFLDTLGFRWAGA
jgi:lysophospholipase L1-like esterase